METEQKFVEAVIEKSSDGLVAVASSNTTDRHGEIVDNNGWDLKAYKKNPLILWGHDHNEPAIGTSTKTWIEGTGKSAKLMIKPELHDVTPRAAAIKELVNRGIIKALSVGFRPLESPDGVTYTKSELLEVSVVNVPANSDAQFLAYKALKSTGLDDDSIKKMKILGTDDLPTEPDHRDKPVEAPVDKPVVDEKALRDEIEALKDDISKLQDLVNVQQHKSKKHTEKRLNMQKVIANAADKILAGTTPEVDRRLVKTIKRATEILTVDAKETLHG